MQTPRGLVRLGGEGRYDVVVGSTDQPTLVTVVEGSAQIEGPGVSLQIAAGQTATITGADTFEGSVGPEQRDGFLTERLNAERPPPPRASIPPQVAAMPGGSDLYGQGNWAPAPEYGQVWYPPVSPGWVPYRQGHWAYVAPWGWTWIDDASWGFAPFHYGRWVQIGGRWAWTPGAVAVAEPPVYAPALVAFIGIGAGVALGAALASGSIGWVPLGPREEYHPWYHASNRYIRQVNVNHVTNVTNITRNVTINNFVNRGAATSVPAAAMMASRPVQGIARPISPQQFAQARPILGQQPLRPSATTAGVTPVVARQLNLPPAAQSRPAPGPAVRAPVPGSAGSGFARPAFAPAGRPGPINAAQPGPGGTPNPEPSRPGGTTPNGQPGPAGAPGASQPNRPGFAAPGTPQGAGQPNRCSNHSTRAPSTNTADTNQPNRPGYAAPGTPQGAGQPNRAATTAPGPAQHQRHRLARANRIAQASRRRAHPKAPDNQTARNHSTRAGTNTSATSGASQPVRPGYAAPSTPRVRVRQTAPDPCTNTGGEPAQPAGLRGAGCATGCGPTEPPRIRGAVTSGRTIRRKPAEPSRVRSTHRPTRGTHGPVCRASSPAVRSRHAPGSPAASRGAAVHAACRTAARACSAPGTALRGPTHPDTALEARPATPQRPEPVAHAAPPPQAHAAPSGPPPGHEKRPGEH